MQHYSDTGIYSIRRARIGIFRFRRMEGLAFKFTFFVTSFLIFIQVFWNFTKNIFSKWYIVAIILMFLLPIVYVHALFTVDLRNITSYVHKLFL